MWGVVGQVEQVPRPLHGLQHGGPTVQLGRPRQAWQQVGEPGPGVRAALAAGGAGGGAGQEGDWQVGPHHRPPLQLFKVFVELINNEKICFTSI